jgi:hypothetical protein
MRFNLLCDVEWESRVDQVLNKFSDLGYRRFFEERNYGSTLDGITIVFNALPAALHLKQRIRHSKKEKKLYIDIMLDLEQFKQIDQAAREHIMAQKLVTDIPPIVAKYKFEDFDLPRFEADLKKWLKKAGLV